MYVCIYIILIYTHEMAAPSKSESASITGNRLASCNRNNCHIYMCMYTCI